MATPSIRKHLKQSLTSFNDDTDTLVINVINRHKDNSIKSDIMSCSGIFSGKAVVNLVNQDLEEAFTFDKQDQYLPEKKEFAVKEHNFTYLFPPHSFVQIRVHVEK